MNKEQILVELKKLSFPKEEYIIIGGSALVLQGIIEKTEDIDLTCSVAFYNSIPWEKKIGAFGKEIKYFSCFEIGTDWYDIKDTIQIEGYLLANLDVCYQLKVLENRKKNKKILQTLEYLLCKENHFYWYEKNLKEQGIHFIAGVDEVGRGPLVGPVVASCVVLPEHFSLEGLTDSKKLSEKKRNYFFDEIQKQALGIGIGVISEKIIDDINIYEATKLAMKEAIENCRKKIKIEHVLIDAMPLDLDIPTTSIIKGDVKSITISAASVIAKVTRDRMMYELDEKYPMYDFKSNKGYPTKKHIDAIQKYGVIKEHRRSYSPVSEYLETK